MNRKRQRVGTMVALGTALGLAVLTGGCGGGSSQIQSPPGFNSPNEATSGSYVGRVTLANNQSARFSVSVDNNGGANGTLLIQNANGSTFAAPVVTGTSSLRTGIYRATGSFVNGGTTQSVVVHGKLPTPGTTTGGNVTVTYNGADAIGGFTGN